jgi:hypothetical protein
LNHIDKLYEFFALTTADEEFMSLGSRFVALWIGATILALPDGSLAADPALSTEQMGHVRHRG